MKLLIRLLAVVLACQLGSIAAQDRAVPLSSLKVGAWHLEVLGADNAVRKISSFVHVPIGLEAYIDISHDEMVVLDFPGGTVGDLLNLFVSRHPDFSWVEDGGIIHVSTRPERPGLGDVEISYPGAQNKTREEVWNDLATIPEINHWMKANDCSRLELMTGKEFKLNNRVVSIEASRMSVSRLLDQVALKSGQDFWEILQTPKGKPCRLHITVW